GGSAAWFRVGLNCGKGNVAMSYGQCAKIPYFKLTRIELNSTREKSWETKPFELLAEGLLREASRGDWTPLVYKRAPEPRGRDYLGVTARCTWDGALIMRVHLGSPARRNSVSGEATSRRSTASELASLTARRCRCYPSDSSFSGDRGPDCSRLPNGRNRRP